MESSTLILGCIILPGMGYLALQSFQQGKQLSSLRTDMNIVKENGDRTNEKLNLFLKTEIDSIKQMASDFTRALDKISQK